MKKRKFLNRLLILFCRNPQLGKVKTRLAASIGDEKALAVYYLLNHHTREITASLPCEKVIYYSEYIDTEDNWPADIYDKSLQQGSDLGERMGQAFQTGFEKKFTSICIIGMDCFDLTSDIVEQAFEELKSHDVVIGPANDGGYYLLGMKQLHTKLFQNKQWSSNSVLTSTLNDCERLGLKTFQLRNLDDVDEVKDLPASILKSLKLL